MSRITFAIGDIHGCVDRLTSLMAECAVFAGDSEANYVFLGDYIDRGPASSAVLKLLGTRQAAENKKRPGSFICLKGSHDLLMTGAFAGQRALVECWFENGGLQTLHSYGYPAQEISLAAARTDDVFRHHVRWLNDLPYFHDDGKRFFVHAGVNPRRPLNEQLEWDMVWERRKDDLDVGRLVVHGHTPLRAQHPWLRQHRLNLDTGAVYGYPLTAAAFVDSRRDPIAFLNSEGEVNMLGASAA